MFNWSTTGWASVVPSSLSSPSRSSVSWQSQSESFYWSLYFSICKCICIFLSVYVFVFFYLYMYLYLSMSRSSGSWQSQSESADCSGGSLSTFSSCAFRCSHRHPLAPPYPDMENVTNMANVYVQFFLVVHLDAPTHPTLRAPAPPYPGMENVANIYEQN